MTGASERVFLESRYRKLVRDLPQTIFWCPKCHGPRQRRRRRRPDCELCGGRGALFDDSVQQLIGRRVLPAFRARDGKFHGAGREDVDVRMLGRGRPFVFEVIGPRRADVDLLDVLARINDQEVGRIEIDPFQVVDRERVAALKETPFDKRYRIGVEADGPIDLAGAAALEGQVLVVAQRTPERVAHRRADLVRERRVTILTVRRPKLDDLPFELDVETQHGTYVKEWVSGDGGRSSPSLAELLGTPSRCARLDVLDILDDGPASRSVTK